jgi:hypothetical protein
MTTRKLAAAILFIAIGIGATACEFGEHRGSHSNVYPEERYYDRYYDQRAYQPAYPPNYTPPYPYRPTY